MPKAFSTVDIQFKKIEPRIPEFIWNKSPRFAKLADSKHLEFDVRSLDPGRFSFPYHFHRSAEELFYIISGEATLRSPEGFQKVIQGENALMEIVNLLVADIPLPYHNFDHPISGEWINHRDCHIKPDLILIYRKIDTDHLDLVRICSHSELDL